MFTRLIFTATNLKVYTNLTFSEHSHVLLLNTDQFTRNESITVKVIRFWDFKTKSICEKENSILHDFQYSIYLNDEGRYEHRLHFKESHEFLPERDNYSFCGKRFLRLYNKLKTNTVLLKKKATFPLSKGRQVLLRASKMYVLWETVTIQHITSF